MGVKLASSWAAAEAPAVAVINLVFTDMLLTFRLSVAVFLQVWRKENKEIENHQMLDIVCKASRRKIKMWLTWWCNNQKQLEY